MRLFVDSGSFDFKWRIRFQGIYLCAVSSPRSFPSNISLKQRNHLKRKQTAIIKTVDQHVEYSCSSETFIINKKCRKWTKLFWNVLNKRITQTNYLRRACSKALLFPALHLFQIIFMLMTLFDFLSGKRHAKLTAWVSE